MIAIAALLALALVPALALAVGENTDGSGDATGEAVAVQQEAGTQDAAASAQPADGTMEVSFLVPIYNEEGNPRSGLRERKTETRVCTVVNDSEADWTDDNATGGWYVAVGGVSLDRSFVCHGKINLVLADGCSLSAQGKETKAGIRVTSSGCSLTVYSQSLGENMGRLRAVGGDGAAGIGGNTQGDDGNNITINGGAVHAIGNGSGAGIGGGCRRNARNILITGGDVTAAGGDRAAGIGGGWIGDGRDITIVGGNVTAKGGYHASGIGSGERGDGYDISVTGGTVTATGGNRGAGIGGGGLHEILFIERSGDGHHISITGGTVSATGGYHASGIGGGNEADGHDISITGGTVNATGGDHGAGIGGGTEEDGYIITIDGGDVTATGAGGGAGIGGGSAGEGDRIAVNGGTVRATGVAGGAGIGGGWEASGHNVSITDGTVIATGSGGAGGIGGGWSRDGFGISISGGDVTATGGEDGGAGIGSGKGHDISITGGTVRATGAGGGAGIGGGNGLAGYGITVSGGDVTATGDGGGAGIGGGRKGRGTDIAIEGGSVCAAGGADGDRCGAGIGGGTWTNSEGVRIAAKLAACYGADGTSWTALTPEQRSGDVSGILDPSRYAAIGELVVGAQQGTLTQGEAGSASYAVSVGASGSAPLTGMTGLAWDGAVPQGATWTYADGTLTVSTSEAAAAGSYAFHVKADGGTSGVAALDISEPVAYDVAYLDADGVQHTCPAAEVAGAACPCWSASGSAGGWYVVDRDISLDGTFTCEGDIHLILADGCTLEASGRDGEPGIAVEGGSTLTVYAQSTGDSMGAIRAEGGEGAAGIGGFARDDAGRVTVDGGRISAAGNGGGAGIGGGEGGAGCRIAVNGGSVDARAVGGGSGVGCGLGCSDCSQPITVAPALQAAVSADGEAWTALSDAQKSGDVAGILAGQARFVAGGELPGGVRAADAAGADSQASGASDAAVSSQASPSLEDPQAGFDPIAPAEPQASPTSTDPANPQDDSQPAALKLWRWLQRLANGTV